MIKAIIFDMDGVLVNSEPLWTRAIRMQFKKYGVTFANLAAYDKFSDQYLRGRTQRDGYRHSKKIFRFKASYPAMLKERLNILYSLIRKNLRPLPGAAALVKKLHQHQLPLVLASSSPPPVIKLAMKKFQLQRYFYRTISGDRCRHSKPHPEIFLKAAKLLQRPPKNILVIEDSISGIKAAKRAGMPCVLLITPYTTKEHVRQADVAVKRLKDITPALISSL